MRNATVAPPVPVNGAWVRLETTPAGAALQVTHSNAEGRFTFLGLRAGRYQLHVRVPGLGLKVRPIDVPSPSGEYDVQYP